MTRIGILETGRPSDRIIERFGDFSQMFMAYFKELPDLEFDVFQIAGRILPPEPNAREAWIITGSLAGVYEDHVWLRPLQNFVVQAMKRAVPTLGVCFGHQLMAQALGGKVVKSDKGRGIGVQAYTLSAESKKFGLGTPTLNLIATHQDQVVTPPVGATVILSSEFCPFAGLTYGTSGLSFQPHPEFTADCGRAMTREWQQRDPIADDAFIAAEKSFDNVTPDNLSLLPLFQNFFKAQLKD